VRAGRSRERRVVRGVGVRAFENGRQIALAIDGGGIRSARAVLEARPNELGAVPDLLTKNKARSIG